jgi:acetyl-CoA carboxylase biotin carboxylase subunit
MKLRKILIANRGEIAVRIIRTCREMGISSVAVFSDADRAMPHVQMADEAYRIGPPPSRESYLNGKTIIEVARHCGADGIHPGYGFLSENPVFAEEVTSNGLVFIGPTARSIRMMGDKTAARTLMQQSGVRVVPGTNEPLSDLAALERFCGESGFPILIKAAAGGGGKGMRVVGTMSDLSAAFRAARSEALSAFGDERVYAEKYFAQPRHIEFQIVADTHGTTVHLGERECSIQRRHQKVIEESPSVVVDDDLRDRMGSAAVRAAEACGYVNAGTIEFLVDKDRNFYFLEMNTRLQVEHPVTEMRTGLDLVALQIRIAEEEPLGFAQQDVSFRGHAVECRIYAEDPSNNYLPATGKIHHLRPSQGFGIRDDRGVAEGGEVSVYYDPMISKLIVWGKTRDEALLRMERALEEYEVLGVSTNIPLNLDVIRHPGFRAGDFDTHFLGNHPDLGKPVRVDPRHEVALAGLAALMSLRQQNGSAFPSREPAFRPNPRPGGRSHGWKNSRNRHLRD